MRQRDPTSLEGAFLRGLAWVQGAVLLVLVILALRGNQDPPPGATGTQPAGTTTNSLAAAQAAAQSAPPVADEQPPTTSQHSGKAEAASPSTRPSADEASTATTELPSGAMVAPAPAGTVLFGSVTDEGGEPIEKGTIIFRQEGASESLATVRLRPGRSSYAIAGVPPGRVEYQPRVEGCTQPRVTIDIPAGATRVREDIVLHASWILTVKIQTPEGTPLHEALAATMKERPMLRHVQVSAVVTGTRPQGDFPPTALREADIGCGRWQGASGIHAILRGGARQPKDVAGTLEIDEPQPLWASAVIRHRVLATVQVDPGQTEVVLTVPLEQVLGDLGTIRGRVVRADTGAPVPKAVIGFGDRQSSGSAGTADDEGRFEVRDLRPGLLDVEIRGQRLLARRDLVLLRPGQTLELGDVPVFEFREIRGRCEGLQGEAVNCRIAYTSLEPPPHPAVRRMTDSTQVEPNGMFRLYLPDGPYRLRAFGAGGCVIDVDTRTLAGQPLVLQLAPEASLRLDVRTNGEPWELALFDSRNREIYRRQLKDGWRFAMTFLPGKYRAELTDSHGNKHIRQLDLGTEGAVLHVP